MAMKGGARPGAGRPTGAKDKEPRQVTRARQFGMMIVHDAKTRGLLAQRLEADPQPSLIIRVYLDDIQDIWPEADNRELDRAIAAAKAARVY